jgi:hypothetical protein
MKKKYTNCRYSFVLIVESDKERLIDFVKIFMNNYNTCDLSNGKQVMLMNHINLPFV